MKTLTRFLLLIPTSCFLVITSTIMAEKSGPSHTSRKNSLVAGDTNSKKVKRQHRGSESDLPLADRGGEQIEMLRRLLETPPEKLRLMRETIQRVENMTPEDREDMRRRLKRFRELPLQRRSEVFRNFHHKQNSLRRYWDSLPQKKRDKELLEFQRLAPHERKAFVDRLSGRSEHGGGKPPFPPAGTPRNVPRHRPSPQPR